MFYWLVCEFFSIPHLSLSSILVVWWPFLLCVIFSNCSPCVYLLGIVLVFQGVWFWFPSLLMVFFGVFSCVFWQGLCRSLPSTYCVMVFVSLLLVVLHSFFFKRWQESFSTSVCSRVLCSSLGGNQSCLLSILGHFLRKLVSFLVCYWFFWMCCWHCLIRC